MVVNSTPDFGGWATKANLKCSDGRTIAPDAFKHQDQARVPLVWQHAHSESSNVLGHAILENRGTDGVYAYGYFNDTENGRNAKSLVQHGDIVALSIYANRLVERDKNVMHGQIRELSLVLAGANPGAVITEVNVAHADGTFTELSDEAVIHTGEPIEPTKVIETSEEEKDSSVNESDDKKEEPVQHADKDETIEEIFDSMNDKQKDVVYFMLGQALKGAPKEVAHSDKEDYSNVLNTLNDKQAEVFKFMLGEALAHAAEQDVETDSDDADGDDDNDTDNDDAVSHASDNQEGSNNMTTRNIFERGAAQGTDNSQTLSHDDMKGILESAQRGSTFKTELEAYALKHGIQDISVLFPDARAVSSTPDLVARRTDWVSAVMSQTRHTPFSRIKSRSANLTLPDARAKGYIKGHFKQEELFRVAKRVTTPTTVYKKQKLDRDDIIDITDFDVVAWLKAEMRLMLEEEIARAVLVGDGRSAGDEDKILEENIRPIATDSDFYVTSVFVSLTDTTVNATAVENVIDALIMQRRHYRGSGNPTFFTSETLLAQLLLIKDKQGRRLYTTDAELASALRVSKILTCEVMDEPGSDVLGLMVNLADYTIGADRGGDVAMFDDFDIDYNQQKYLIETRISGALTKPKSALVLKRVPAGATLRTPSQPTWNAGNHSVTVPTTTGVTYKNKLTNATLVTGTPVVLSPDQSLTVIALPASGTDYLASSAQDEFNYTYEDGFVGSGF